MNIVPRIPAPRLLAAAVNGAVTGASILFLVFAGAVGIAYATTSPVHVPGVVQAWSMAEKGAPALYFVPDFSGMLLWIGLCAAVTCLVAWLRDRDGAAEESPVRG